jgi:hypothetical protein
LKDLDGKVQRIILQINKKLNLTNFNHYRPANKLARLGVDVSFFSENTLVRFEQMFDCINSLFDTN